MPKHKPAKKSDTSDSDSGPEDVIYNYNLYDWTLNNVFFFREVQRKKQKALRLLKKVETMRKVGILVRTVWSNYPSLKVNGMWT